MEDDIEKYKISKEDFELYFKNNVISVEEYLKYKVAKKLSLFYHISSY